MGVKRYWATKDNTITNAYKSNLSTRATGSNMGASDILEVFSIYGQAVSASATTAMSSSELSRILIAFPATGGYDGTIGYDRDQGTIPASGSVKFYLKMFNAPHSQTTPRNYTLEVAAVSSSISSSEGGWAEGYGLDMDEYADLTYDKTGSNWLRIDEGTAWANEGGDWYDRLGTTLGNFHYQTTFSTGVEDLEVDVTPLVEQWINSSGQTLGEKDNHGFMIKLSGTFEATSSLNPTGSTNSFYTKKFFGKTSEFFFRRPILEARWDSTKKDDRGSFHYSSSLAPGEDNLNTIYFYNYVRGKLRDVPEIGTTGSIMVALYSGSSDNDAASGSALELSVGGGVSVAAQTYSTGGWVSTGIYSASVAFTGAAGLTKVWDVWSSGTIDAGNHSKNQFHTGTIIPQHLSASNYNPSPRFTTTITNLRDSYSRRETARFRLFVRERDWNPNIYTRAQTTPANQLIDSASYRIYRVTDNLDVIPYGTASSTYRHTHLSFDVSGNYFDLDLEALQADYAYGISFAYYNGAIASWVEQPETFKFRVDE